MVSFICEVKVFNIVAASLQFCFLALNYGAVTQCMQVQDNWFRKVQKEAQVEINHSFRSSSLETNQSKNGKAINEIRLVLTHAIC